MTKLKKILVFFAVIFCAVSFSLSSVQEDIRDLFVNALEGKDLKTGDILLRGSNDLFSLVLQKITEGPYSHAAIVWHDNKGVPWALDIFPGQGLRKRPLDEFFKAERNVVIHAALVRYKENLDEACMESSLKRFWQSRDHVEFDYSWTVNSQADWLIQRFLNKPSKIYCSELIYWVYQDCISNTYLFQNDFPIISKYTAYLNELFLDTQIKDELNRVLTQEHIRQLNWGMPRYTITANGIRRSVYFDTLCEVAIPVQVPEKWKKYLAE